jgi:hypothetical protein
MRRLLLTAFFTFMFVEMFPQVLLNEFSSSNLTTITDEDGEYPDWIELYNGSSSDFNLRGYHLSDSRSNRNKWTFPEISMQPGSYLLIFASGKNRTTLPVTYKTIIAKGADWQYLVPQSEQGDSWKTTGFDASSWNTGSSGFGFGDDDDATILESTVSVFIRNEFVLSDIQNITQLVLSIDYDDGFVAYINGHEIARSNLGTISPVPYNQTTGSILHEALMYQGGYPETYIIQNPGLFLIEGANVIAIQGHNADAASSDFSLIPMLSIGRTGVGGSDSVPSYIQLKGNRLHTNFKIKEDGETLVLSSPDSSIMDSIPSIRLAADFSYGRQPDGQSGLFYFSAPTPGGPNNTRSYTELNADTVFFSHKGGYYPGGISLSMSTKLHSDSIFYTLDGSEPTLNSKRFSTPVSIPGNIVVRARSLKANILPGPVATNTYITTKHTLPVVCISTDPPNLWDYYTGIYATGPNASTESPYFGANFWQDWERKAHLEYYDSSGVKQIDQDAGLKIHGAYSRALPEKSFALFARKMYGKGSFDFKFFRDKPITKFESLVLRNAGNDWDQAFVRDGFTSVLVRDMNMDRQAFQPCVIYLNGEYWGLLNMREKVNENYLAENHYVNPDNVSILENWGTPLEGYSSSYDQIRNYLDNNTLETDTKYKQVSSQIDVDNYIQYMLSEIYVNNKDWPGNNIKFWRSNDNNGLWRWIIYDTDFGFSIWEESAYTFNTVAFALEPNGSDWPNPAWSTLLFRKLSGNPGFRNEFSNQMADRLNRNFSSEHINVALDSIKKMYLPEISAHLARWNLSVDTWQYNYSLMRTFGLYRPGYLRTYLRYQFNLGEPTNIGITIDQPGTGIVKVNSIIPYKFPFNGVYFKDLPITLTAIPLPGYKFVRWEMGSVQSTNVKLTYNMAEAKNFRAVFEQARNTDIKVVINEINYISLATHDTKDWIELYNAGSTTVDLKDWTISDGIMDSGFVFRENYLLSPGSFIVVCKNQAAFRLLCPNVTRVTGDFSFGLSSSGDNVFLYNDTGDLVDFVNYGITSPWPTDAARKGSSIELTDPLSDNNDGKNWKSGNVGGTPGSVNSVYNDQDTTGNDVKKCRISCYPNPFSDYTTLQVEIKASGRYKVEIFDLQGRVVSTLSDQNLEAGRYSIDWNGKSDTGAPLPAGVYIIRLAGEEVQSNTRVVKLS